MNGLLSTPIFWLSVTLVIFQAADTLSKRSRRHPLCHPVLLSTPILIGLLLLTHTSYEVYLNATQYLGFLLGPAIVGLALPIWTRRAIIRQLALPIALALFAGAVTAILSAVGIMKLFGATDVILDSIAPRAVTTPVAMEMSKLLGGIPALSAVIVLLSGIVGAMTATPLFNAMKITDYRARGFAIGLSSHGFGAAWAFQVSPTAGTFASLGMALNTIMTSLLLSLIEVLK